MTSDQTPSAPTSPANKSESASPEISNLLGQLSHPSFLELFRPDPQLDSESDSKSKPDSESPFVAPTPLEYVHGLCRLYWMDLAYQEKILQARADRESRPPPFVVRARAPTPTSVMSTSENPDDSKPKELAMGLANLYDPPVATAAADHVSDEAFYAAEWRLREGRDPAATDRVSDEDFYAAEWRFREELEREARDKCVICESLRQHGSGHDGHLVQEVGTERLARGPAEQQQQQQQQQARPLGGGDLVRRCAVDRIMPGSIMATGLLAVTAWGYLGWVGAVLAVGFMLWLMDAWTASEEAQVCFCYKSK